MGRSGDILTVSEAIPEGSCHDYSHTANAFTISSSMQRGVNFSSDHQKYLHVQHDWYLGSVRLLNLLRICRQIARYLFEDIQGWKYPHTFGLRNAEASKGAGSFSTSTSERIQSHAVVDFFAQALFASNPIVHWTYLTWVTSAEKVLIKWYLMS